MIELRPIKVEEAEQFLRLLCKVFALDFRRASDVFYREPLFDINRKWAAIEKDEIVCTLTTVPLTFGDGHAIGIAGVATSTERRGQSLATQLIDEVMRAEEKKGGGRALLFASKENLYKRCGFVTLDQVVSQPLPPGKKPENAKLLVREEIMPVYDVWARQDSRRLIRDPRRWEYWGWNMKTAYQQKDGYICYEFGRVRELLPGFENLPFADSADWFGLTTMAELLSIPLSDARMEMLLMGRNFDYVPQVFMTDQF